MNRENKESNSVNSKYNIPLEGSLGLLALGDIGLRAWRKVKREARDKNKSNEKK